MESETCFSKITEIGLWKCIHHKATKPEPSFVFPCRVGEQEEGGKSGEGAAWMKTGVEGGGYEGRGGVAQAILAWTSEMGMLYCLFNRKQI